MQKLAAVVVAAACAAAFGQVTTELVTGGLALPLYVTQSPGDLSTRLFIVEQRGHAGTGNMGAIRIHKDGVLLPTPFLTRSPVTTGDEQGLLGLAFHPDYASNRKFYIYFTNFSGSTVIEEYQTSESDPDVADVSTRRTVLTFSQPFTNHNGGWMGFGPDGFLYIASGDGGSSNDPGNRATNITNGSVTQYLGKMLRIDPDGDDFPADSNRNYRIPPGNPFGAAGTAGAEIWALGLRNPWRNSFDRLTGDFWIADVGQGNREEVNFQPASSAGGEDYGWRCREGRAATNNTGCNTLPDTDPIFDYPHSNAFPPISETGCSVTGGYVYRGCAIPSLYGRYVFGDYCGGWVRAYDRATHTSQRILALGFGITSFGEDNDGELYVVLRGSGSNGSVRRIIPTTPPPDCNGNGRADCADIASGRSQDQNNNGIPDECECAADFNGDGQVDFFDYLDFVQAFDNEDPSADFNGDGQVDFFDYLDFVQAFDEGCE